MHQRQKGISYWGIVMAVGLFGLAIKVGAVVGPIYLDNMTINKVASNTVQSPDSKDMTPVDFKDTLDKALKMNSITDRKVEDVMTFSREGDGYVVNVQYEERQNLIGNLDVVVHFAKSFSVEHPDGVDIVPEEKETTEAK